MKKAFLALFLIVMIHTAVSAQNVRVNCDRLTMNVPSENASCYQIERSVVTDSDEADDSELEGGIIAKYALVLPDFRKNSAYEPEVSYYSQSDLMSSNLRFYDIFLGLQDLLNNVNVGAEELETASQTLEILPFHAGLRTAQGFLKQISFEGGEGIAMVACYEDTVHSYAETNLFYTMQALSEDKQTYITAVIPLTINQLDGKNASEIDWNSVTENDFSPTLTDLNTYLSSIVFE